MWESSAVSSFHNGEDAENLCNYRPISILFSAVKLFQCLFLWAKWTSLVYKYFITIRVTWFPLSSFYNCSIIKSDKWLCSQLLFRINVILCGGLSLLATFDLMRGSRFYLAFFLSFGMWQLCLSDRKQFIFKWGSWKFFGNEGFGISHGNIRGSCSRLWQCPQLYVSTSVRQSWATTQNCNNFFPFSPVGFQGAGLKSWVFQHFVFLLTPDDAQVCDQDFYSSSIWWRELWWLQL